MTPTLSLAKLFLFACLLAHTSHALSVSTSSSRRAFLAKAAATSSLIPTVKAANAYGEFEPGAKARKKAAQDKKSSSKSTSSTSSSASASSAPEKPEDLKAALGDFSYGASPSKKK